MSNPYLKAISGVIKNKEIWIHLTVQRVNRSKIKPIQMIISEITYIRIERPDNLVTEMNGINLETKTEVRLKAVNDQNPVCYIKSPKTGNSILVQVIRQGSNDTPCFYAEDDENPSKNLLIDMERKLTGGEPK